MRSLLLIRNFTILILIITFGGVAGAQNFESDAREAIMVDLNTNTVIYEKNPDARGAPSSMSKLITLYVLFDRLKSGALKLDDSFKVSEKAWRMGGSKSFLPLGNDIKIEDLIRSIIIHSGNDACVVVAEGISGTEENFAAELNKYAVKLGLQNSHFVNSTGWPAENHYMTMRDIATLSRHLISDFPQYYHYFSETEFAYNKIKQQNRNVLLTKNSGVDGLKTGHTEEAGYGLAASALRDGRRIVAVINGTKSMQQRAKTAELLLDYGFREFTNHKIFSAGQVVENGEIWFGEKDLVPLVVGQDIEITLNNNQKNTISAKSSYISPILAPIKKGQEIGKLIIKRENLEDMEIPLYAGEEIEKLSFFRHIFRAIKLKFLS